MRHFTLRAVNYFLDCLFFCRPIWGNATVSAFPHVMIAGGGTPFPQQKSWGNGVPPPLHHWESAFCIIPEKNTSPSSTSYRSLKKQINAYYDELRIYSDYRILKNYISQQEQLRRCGIFSNHFITNFAQNVPVKNWKSVNLWQRCGQKFAAYFIGPPCILCSDIFFVSPLFTR